MKRVWRQAFLSILFFLLFMGASLSANVSNFHDREVELSIDYAHVILKVAAEIEEEGGYKKSEFLKSPESFKGFYQKHQKHFVSFYKEKFDLSRAQTSELRYYLEQIKVKNWRPIMQEIFQWGRTYLRSGGPGMALAFSIGNISKYAVPFALYKMGLTGLAFVAYMSPWVPVALAFPKMLGRLNYRRKMIKILGGKREYLDYRQMSETFHNRVGLKTPEHFLHPLEFKEDGAVKAVSLKTSGLWQFMMGRLGFGKGSISVYSLRSFLFVQGEHSVDKEEINAIINQPVSKKMKIVQLVRGIYRLGDEELIQKFEERFHKSFVEVRNLGNWEKGIEWVKKMQNARSISQIKELIEDVPDNVDAREIMGLWEEILLPHYAREYQFSYDSYRKLIEDFDRLKVELKKNSQKSWGEFSSRFEHYFLEGVLRSQWEKCYPDLPSLFKLLTLKNAPILPAWAVDKNLPFQKV